MPISGKTDALGKEQGRGVKGIEASMVFASPRHPTGKTPERFLLE